MPFEEPRPDWHSRVNPLGGIPALIDGDVVLAESNAILRYLAAREGRDDLLPGRRARARPRRLAAGRGRDDAAARQPRGRRARLRLPAAARHRRGARRSPRPCRPRSRGIEPRLTAFSHLLGDGGYACLGRLTWPTAPRCRRSGACSTRAPSRGHARLLVWARRSARTPRGARSRPRAGSRRDHEPCQRAGQGRTRARRGEGAQAHRSLRGRGRGRAARRAGRRHHAGRGVRRRRPRQRSHRRRAGRGGREGAALLGRGDGGALVALVTRAGQWASSRANDLPPLAAGSPASEVGLHLHGVSDPGNLGTLLRSAQGFGPAHVALAEGCADPLSPRAVRASMGALYSVPVITLREAPDLPVIALDARGERTLAELAPTAPVAFALGGERTGLPDEVTTSAGAVARIPLAEGSESLNVAIAGALALYELRRCASQRRVPVAGRLGGCRRRPGRRSGRSGGRRRSPSTPTITSRPASRQSARHSAALRHSSVIGTTRPGRRTSSSRRRSAASHSGRSQMPSRRAIQRSCVARMSAALGSKTSKTKRPPSAEQARRGAQRLHGAPRRPRDA